MSDVTLVALISAVGSVVISVGVVAVNLFYNYRSAAAERAARATEREEDRPEWYRRTMFEKRLAAVQEAYAWKARLREGVGRIGEAKAVLKDPDEVARRRKELLDTAECARDWWNRSSVFLEDDSPRVSSFVGLTNTAGQYVGGDISRSELEKSFGEVEEEIRERAKSLMALEEERSA